MEQIGEATAGGVGAVVSVTAMYPLVSTKIRLQAHKKKKANGDDAKIKPYKNAFDCLTRTIKEEGVLRLFSGINSAVFKGFWTNFIFYFCFSWLKKVFHPKGSPKPGLLKSMVHGICAGICVQLLMAPIDMVNTRLVVADKGSKSNVSSILKSIIKERGVLGLWSGIAPALILTLNPGITNVIRNKLMPTNHMKKLTPGQNFAIGATSKAVASMTTYPYVVAKVTMQTMDKSETDSPKTLQVLNDIVQSEGIPGLYKGCDVQVLTAVLKEAILNMVRMEINYYVMKLFRAMARKRKAKN